jgi:O-antigen/teichoic acid export membrane protein
MTHGHRAGVVSGSIGFVSRAVVQVLLFGVTIVATRTLSIADFGAYSLATIFIILSRAMFYVGPYEYLLKANDRPDLLRSCFSANLILACGAAVLLVVVHFIAPLIFASHIVGQLVLWLAPTIILVAVTAWYEAVLLRAMRVRRYYVSTVVGDSLGAAVAVGLLLNGYGVMSLVAQAYARLAVLLLLYVRATREQPSLFAPRGEIAKVLAWSKSRYAAVLLNFTSAYGADMVLGASLSPAATGIYRASNRIVSTLTDLFAQPLQKIAQTNLSAG